jgi:hypothetical protein
MTRPARIAHDLGTALIVAGKNASAGAALAQASSQVIAARVALGMQGAADPARADYGELARILPEKAEAASAAWIILLLRSGQIAQQVGTFAATEMTAAATAAMTMAASPSAAALAVAQRNYAGAAAGRWLAQSLALGTIAMRWQHAALLPYRRTVTANARRLARS